MLHKTWRVSTLNGQGTVDQLLISLVQAISVATASHQIPASWDTQYVATLNAQRIDRRFIYPIFRYLVLYLYIYIYVYKYEYIYIKPGSLKIRGTLTCPSEAPMFELPVPAWNVPVFDAQTHLSTVLREASVHRQWWIYHIYKWCDSYLDTESCL